MATLWFPNDKLLGDVERAGVFVPPPAENVKLKLSIPVDGLFPEPVVAPIETILIQIGPAILSKAVPKSTLIILFENNEPPVVKVPVVVAAVNDVGEAPMP